MENIHYIDITWIDEKIKGLKDEQYLHEMTNKESRSKDWYERYYNLESTILTLEKVKSQLKPITPLIEDALDKGEELSRLFGKHKMNERFEYLQIKQ